MASRKNHDYSGEIYDFRQSLSAALSRKIDILEYEIERVKRLSLKLPEKPALMVVGKIDLTKFDPRNSMKRERIKSGRSAIVKDNPSTQDENGDVVSGVARPDTSAEDDKKELYLRRGMLELFIAEASAFVDFVRTTALLCSTFQFAVIRKEITDLNCDCRVFTPYTGRIPTLDEMTNFLISYYLIDDQLTREFLTKLSIQHNSILVLSAVCDNLKERSIDLEKAKSSIKSAILSFGEEQVPFSKNLGAFIVALKNCRFQQFDYYISTAQKATRKSLFGRDFLFPDQSIYDLDIIDEEKEKCLEELKGVLEDAKGKELFSQEEFNAIDGSSSSRKQEHPNLAEAKKPDRINDSPIECPKDFKNHPEALRRFFHQIINKKFILVDEDSFLYWFNSLSIDKDKVSRITWLKGITDLKCFIEALYPLHDSYQAFMQVFVGKNGKEFTTLGGNALVYRAVASKRKKVSDLPYGKRTGKKAYDDQKKIIDEIKDLIKQALTEQ